MTIENFYKALKQYEQERRQVQLGQVQSFVSLQEQRKQQTQGQVVAMEGERRSLALQQSEQQSAVGQQLIEQRQCQQEEYEHRMRQLAEELRILNQKQAEIHASLTVKIQDRLQEMRQMKVKGSPIEIAFQEAWKVVCPNIELLPQYTIGKYRVDFVHIETKTVIELDGHATHSSKKDRTYDYQRQRAIEAMGWVFVRFTGSEVWNDVRSCVAMAGGRIQERMAR